MIHFCDNQACAFHVAIPDEKIDRVTITSHNGNKVPSRRWILTRETDKKEFAFCTSCANVAAMINEIKN